MSVSRRAGLRLVGVSKAFRGRPALAGVDLDVAPGEMVCLIGPSGSGKSTVLKCINLTETVDDGAILLDGEEISAPGLDPRPVRARIGMVFQSFNLFPHMTAEENVTLAPRRVRGLSRAALEPEVAALFARFGLAEKRRAYPDQLSGGQQQRVAIIRALAMRPQIMLFDEITSALDPELVKGVLDALRTLKAEGMTMLLATHEMGFAREVADRVAMLDAGRLVEIAPPGELFGAPKEARTRAFLEAVL